MYIHYIHTYIHTHSMSNIISDWMTHKHTFPKALQKSGSILKKSSSLPAGDGVLGPPPVRGLMGLLAALYCTYSRFR